VTEATLCSAFSRLATRIEDDVRASAADPNLGPEAARLVLTRATPIGAQARMGEALAAEGLDSQEVSAFVAAHPDVAERCGSVLAARMLALEEPLRRIAEHATRADGGPLALEIVPHAAGRPGPTADAGAPIAWIRTDVARAVADAATRRQPTLVLFCATWAAACGELASQTFADPRVRAAVRSRYVAVQLYEDEPREPDYQALSTRFAVHAMPTLIILDERGTERHRYTSFVQAEALLASL
jgi:hypothetical protein